MHAFCNILVAIDLAHNVEMGSAVLEPRARQAVRTALFLGRQTVATLTFGTVLGEADAAALALARTILANLSEEARQDGLQGQTEVAVGSGWGEILRTVEHGRHDLVLIGAPRTTRLSYTLFGSTATKLLRECPCPVWVALPSARTEPRSLLIASDLTPVSTNALRVGTSLARDLGVTAHVLHVVDYPLDHRWSTGDCDAPTAEYHRQFRAKAIQDLCQQLETIGCWEGRGSTWLHAVGRTGVPDVEVIHFLQDHQIDLLVLGRSAQDGLSQRLLGHTAQRLLPEVSCPLLAV